MVEEAVRPLLDSLGELVNAPVHTVHAHCRMHGIACCVVWGLSIYDKELISVISS